MPKQKKNVVIFQKMLFINKKSWINFEKKLKQGKPVSIDTEDLRENLIYFWNCFLFGCARHGNLMADDES
ncbi:hypothetical protein EGK75_10960 [Neisseria weixii]|nr:hypothetical protein CGZ65_00615 [Neisseria weixii]RPD84962.1 hypothetical protein EGK75_10960 [Neisseria weixii]